jgi:hypothetical protein
MVTALIFCDVELHLVVIDVYNNMTRKTKTCTRPYNEGKSTHEIVKERRISFRNIRVILNKTIKEKTKDSKENKIMRRKSKTRRTVILISFYSSLQTLFRR